MFLSFSSFSSLSSPTGHHVIVHVFQRACFLINFGQDFKVTPKSWFLRCIKLLEDPYQDFLDCSWFLPSSIEVQYST